MCTYSECAHRASQELEQGSTAFQTCRHPANLLLLLFLGYVAGLCTNSCAATYSRILRQPLTCQNVSLLRHCKDKHAAEPDSRMLGAVKKTFIGVKEYKSRIHDIKQLKSLHGTGPFVCKVSLICPNLHLPKLSSVFGDRTPQLYVISCATAALIFTIMACCMMCSYNPS